jgi:type II secretory pathway predicted ATPase ExeA
MPEPDPLRFLNVHAKEEDILRMTSQKKFNIAGPCEISKHYMLPALPRIPQLSKLVGGEEYFVLHAPRQSGKTTTIKAAVSSLNKGETYHALYCSLEELREMTDQREAMGTLVDNILGALKQSQVDDLKRVVDSDFLAEMHGWPNFKAVPLRICLMTLCARLEKDLVIFFDEADCLKGRVLLSFLAQLRVGYVQRSETPFPRSIALIGMHNIRDYKGKIRPDSESLGSVSQFNIITEVLGLSNFTAFEITALFSQHSEATGQIFQDEAVKRVWYWTEGQPWLVNALAREVVEKILVGGSQMPISAKHIDQAADNIIRRRDTHIESVVSYLKEPRVQRFIVPMLAASEDSVLVTKEGESFESLNNDLQYCLDLGILKRDGKLRPANRIYSTIMVRYLNENIQEQISTDYAGKWMDEHGIDMSGLLKEFQKFWAVNSEKYLKGVLFKEIGPHMLLTAFLQTVVNGGPR